MREPSNTTNVRNLEDQMVAAIQQAISKNPPADDSEVDRYDRGLFELSRALRGIPGFDERYTREGRRLLKNILEVWLDYHENGDSCSECDVDDFVQTMRYVKQPKRESGAVFMQAVAKAKERLHPAAQRAIEEHGFESLALQRLCHLLFLLADQWGGAAFPLSCYQAAQALRIPGRAPARIAWNMMNAMEQAGVIKKVSTGKSGSGGSGNANTWKVIYENRA